MNVINRIKAIAQGHPNKGASARTESSEPANTGRRERSDQNSAFSKVELRIHKVVCKKTTLELLKKDDMMLAAIETLAEVKEERGGKGLGARIKAGERLDLGKFGKDDVRTFDNGKVVASFPYGEPDAPWPRAYPVILVLIEKDKGSAGAIINDIIGVMEQDVARALSGLAAGVATGIASSVAVGAGVGASVGSVVPLLGTAVGTAVGTGIAAAVAGIKQARKHDCFTPEMVKLELARAPKTSDDFPDAEGTVRFEDFGGIYRVTYSWRLA